MIFAALLGALAAGLAKAQEVPGRELLTFPLGALALPRPLPESTLGALWNPAAGVLGPGDKGEVGFSALTTPLEQGVNGRMVSGAMAFAHGWVGLASFAAVSVSDIVRTETDPQTLGEIAYQTSVTSLGVARGWSDVQVGAALRYRNGTLDTEHRGVVATDAGVTVSRLLGTPIRLAASTFMFAPTDRTESATYLTGIDAPIVRRDSAFTVRGGYALTVTERRSTEHYAFVSLTQRYVDAQLGLARTVEFGTYLDAMRFGLGLRYGRYRIRISREDGTAGAGGSYQFLLSSVFR
jgi:hypothetical protein